MILRKRGIVRIISIAKKHRLHVVLCATTATWAWGQLTSSRLAIGHLLVVSFMMLFIYEWNRLFDTREDRINSTRQAVFTKRKKYNLTLISICALVISIFLAIFLSNIPSLSILIIVATLGFLYSTPLSGKATRLKNIPILKNLTSATGWALLTVIYPAVDISNSISVDQVIAAVLMFLTVWCVELIWDIRDWKGDKSANIRTIPVLRGLRESRIWIHSINIISATLLLSAIAMRALPILWSVILFNNGMIIFILLTKENIIENRNWSHLLVTAQTVLLMVMGLLANNSYWFYMLLTYIN